IAIERLKALAAIDPFKADQFYEKAKDDIVAEKRNGIVALLGRALNDMIARDFAGAIVAGRPPEGYGLLPLPPLLPDPLHQLPGWLAQADHLATGHFSYDAGIGDALRAHVIGHVARQRHLRGAKARANRNRLLEVVLEGGAPD
ncbi:MAG: hypothetical protein HQL37_14970, partial [Alphaproteobacteria bacterium]|nr:hypothetical protein [Alphaproteobacteria bacterium]